MKRLAVTQTRNDESNQRTERRGAVDAGDLLTLGAGDLLAMGAEALVPGVTTAGTRRTRAVMRAETRICKSLD